MDTPMLKYKKNSYMLITKKNLIFDSVENQFVVLWIQCFFIFIEIVISVGTVPNC